MSYYVSGDEVIYTPKSIKAKIVKPLAVDDYLIEFADKSLIPPQMIVPGTTLKPAPLPYNGFGWDWTRQTSSTSYTDTNCRRCGGLWTETWISKKAFYDCLKCNIKKEDS